MMRVTCDSCQSLVINGKPSHEQGCTGRFTLSKRGRDYRIYRIFSLDVWGNAREGFEVNDWRERGTITLPIDASDTQIIRALKNHGDIGKRIQTRSFHIDGDDYIIEIDWKRTSEPLFTLEVQ